MLIYDKIHGYIDIDDISTSIINTPVFQRLKNIHQTGLLYFVYPTANHTRFEHSIGTYYLANLMINKLANKYPRLNITKEIIFIVSVAGLCHDLGHLIYSHFFDNIFLKSLTNYKILNKMTKNTVHENRSINFLYYIIKKYKIDINQDQFQVISDLINPYEANYNKWKPQYQIGKWIFQIIANPVNYIDVDKFDYITRDIKAIGLSYEFNYINIINNANIIDNNIYYSTDCTYDIYNMFLLRYSLHKEIYNHKIVKAIELLILNLLLELEKEFNISAYLFDIEKLFLLDDLYIWNQLVNENIKIIINNIQEKNFQY